MTTDQFISKVEELAASHGIAPSTFCEKAGQGGLFFLRIKSGKARCWPETMQKVLSYSPDSPKEKGTVA